MSNSIRNFLIGIALLALGAQVHAQATDVDCNGCVNTSDIASRAVTTQKIQPNAVTSGKIASRAVTTDKIASKAVTTQKIQPNAITSGKIKDGAVNASKIDPAQVQMRVGDSCAVGSFIAAIAENGSVSCEKGGTAAVFTANGFDFDLVALVDQQRFWLDACLTLPYVAGPGETALVTASVGFSLTEFIQGDVLVSSFVAGVPTGYGNGYLWFGNPTQDITAVHHIPLADGVEYRFGATILPQGTGVSRSRLVCQTMVQIVRTTP